VEVLSLVAGWIVAVFVGAAGALILWKLLTNQIKLDKLISEPNGDASLSRFQFLIFTFIVGMGVLVVTLRQSPPAFPEIPVGILALLGISAGSYVVAKGIQVQRDTRFEQIRSDTARAVAEQAVATGVAPNGAAGVATGPLAAVAPASPADAGTGL
jgi:hypothetical protein